MVETKHLLTVKTVETEHLLLVTMVETKHFGHFTQNGSTCFQKETDAFLASRKKGTNGRIFCVQKERDPFFAQCSPSARSVFTECLTIVRQLFAECLPIVRRVCTFVRRVFTFVRRVLAIVRRVFSFCSPSPAKWVSLALSKIKMTVKRVSLDLQEKDVLTTQEKKSRRKRTHFLRPEGKGRTFCGR